MVGNSSKNPNLELNESTLSSGHGRGLYRLCVCAMIFGWVLVIWSLTGLLAMPDSGNLDETRPIAPEMLSGCFCERVKGFERPNIAVEVKRGASLGSVKSARDRLVRRVRRAKKTTKAKDEEYDDEDYDYDDDEEYDDDYETTTKKSKTPKKKNEKKERQEPNSEILPTCRFSIWTKIRGRKFGPSHDESVDEEDVKSEKIYESSTSSSFETVHSPASCLTSQSSLATTKKIQDVSKTCQPDIEILLEPVTKYITAVSPLPCEDDRSSLRFPVIAPAAPLPFSYYYPSPWYLPAYNQYFGNYPQMYYPENPYNFRVIPPQPPLLPPPPPPVPPPVFLQRSMRH